LLALPLYGLVGTNSKANLLPKGIEDSPKKQMPHDVLE